jgi:hypothetical protein
LTAALPVMRFAPRVPSSGPAVANGGRGDINWRSGEAKEKCR